LVIFGEDLAALLGLAFALAAVSMAMITGNPVYDAIGSIGIGVLLILISVLIGAEIKALLIGQGVEPGTLNRMRKFLEDQDEIQEIFNLLTMQFGDDVMVAVKARMKPQGSEAELVAAINRCEVKLKAEFPDVLWSFFEPDLSD
jgi:divalent metal cation (Fe/Co/Zn/Cd) transporter